VERYRALTWIFSQQAPLIAAVDQCLHDEAIPCPAMWEYREVGNHGTARIRCTI